ncbi:hypothetical protein ACFY7C_12540 [Streptomyces sp. NPDC012769]|uniref:hypothetical protein n=1 Tax=Streptomyces sp. NPDC012769 TaxID=3364848 RepID=UPI0036C12D26
MTDGIWGTLTGMFRGRRDGGELVRDEAGLARVDAEITAFGEALAAHGFNPGAHPDDPVLLADWQEALDFYEQAKREFVGDRNPRDAADVLRTLDTGRHALARVDAVLAGRPRPARTPPCFFDPRHGPSTDEVVWAPPEGAPRTVAVCAADAVRLAEGLPPIATGPATRPAARPRVARPAASVPPAATPSGPYATWPEHTGARSRWESRGTKGVQLHRPDPRQPVLLVVHLERAADSWVEVEEPVRERGRPWQILTHASTLTRAVVPVPADGAPTVRVHFVTRKGWRAWLHPLEDVPLLEGPLSGEGSYVVRHPGGRSPLRITQDEGSAFALSVLGRDLRTAETLCRGEGAFTATVTAPKKECLLYVESRGSWRVEPSWG